MEEECIICLETINKETYNYRTDICPNCNYIVHIDCYEKYIEHCGKQLCVVCNNEFETHHHSTIYQGMIIQRPITSMPILEIQRNSYNRRCQALIGLLSIAGVIFLISIIIGVFFKRL